MEFYLVFFLLAAFAQKLQSGRMIVAWVLLGMMLGLYYPPAIIRQVYEEILAMAIVILLTLLVFNFIVDVQVFNNYALDNPDRKLPHFVLIFFHIILSALLIAFGIRSGNNIQKSSKKEVS